MSIALAVILTVLAMVVITILGIGGSPTSEYYADITSISLVSDSGSIIRWLWMGGAKGVLISGSAYGHTSPVKFPSGICQLVLTAERDTTIEAPEAEELCLYVVSGSATVGDTTLGDAQMAVLNPARPCAVKLAAGTRIMFAGGDALDGPRFLDWNFVASSKERLAKAASDWRASIAGGFDGTWFTQPPHETAWIPLPGDPQPPGMDHDPDDDH